MPVDLKEVLTEFPQADAYHILSEIVIMCGVGSVLFALSEIADAAQLRVERTACQYCGAETVEEVCVNLNCDGGFSRRRSR